jgi:hypothetical protein
VDPDSPARSCSVEASLIAASSEAHQVRGHLSHGLDVLTGEGLNARGIPVCSTTTVSAIQPSLVRPSIRCCLTNRSTVNLVTSTQRRPWIRSIASTTARFRTSRSAQSTTERSSLTAVVPPCAIGSRSSWKRPMWGICESDLRRSRISRPPQLEAFHDFQPGMWSEWALMSRFRTNQEVLAYFRTSG